MAYGGYPYPVMPYGYQGSFPGYAAGYGGNFCRGTGVWIAVLIVLFILLFIFGAWWWYVSFY
ncbi:hypothetical protein [Neobacillus fumarioli]|uniref:hypothetical protein n=1 Tax=Neobacillus fumarioli TaxID=105229 RepID=UPI00082CA1EB|nr:hypothetical protein [Neobacillus fumarioli]